MEYYCRYIKYKNKYFNAKYCNIETQNGGTTNSKKFAITVKNPWFNFIRDGSKTVEGRLNRGSFLKMNKGDIVTWVNNDNKINTVVKYNKKYDSFEKMLKNERIENVLPSISNIMSGVNTYRKFYSEKDEMKNGIVAIGIEKITHESKLQDPHYQNILDGKKIYEARVYDEKRRKIKVGDEYVFFHNDDETKKSIHTIITDILTFDNFGEAIESVGIENILPGESLEDGVKLYESFPGYRENAKKYGVVVYKLEKYSNNSI